MNARYRLCLAVLLALFARGASADDVPKPDSGANAVPRSPHQAIDKAIRFLIDDTAKWRKERGCATCHHGNMSVWALTEARAQGYAVPAEDLAEITRWSNSRFIERLHPPRDPRPGWRLVSIAGINLGIMARNLPILSRDDVNTLALHLARHQEEDGSFEMPPPANGAPPIWESPETLVRMALIAWENNTPANADNAALIRSGREKALAWLASHKPEQTAQAITLRVLFDVQTEAPAAARQANVDQLLKLQRSDGGWSQSPELPSDAFATGQALYALSFASVPASRAEIQRAIAFLTTTQRDDGSWPMTSRNHPGVTSTRNPIRNPMPITYFGSAWATLGLVRLVPTAADTPARRQHALDQVQSFHGKTTVDEAAADKPVIGVDLGYYDVDDSILADFGKTLSAFPKLTSLRFKSKKITDAGLTHLNGLTQLRSLTLEDATITDAGLASLKELNQLEELNLTGTQVTATGVEGFNKLLPKVKVKY